MKLSSIKTITTEKEQGTNLSKKERAMYCESIRLILLYAHDSLYPLVT
jgi:hypothetical protein